MRALMLLLALFAGFAPSAVLARPMEASAVRLVECGGGTGSGALISKGRMVTAWHVAQHGGCRVEGQVATIIEYDAALDYAVLAVDVPGRPLKLSCRRPKLGERFQAGGWALGDRLLINGLSYAGESGRLAIMGADGNPVGLGDVLVRLDGLIYPGMSGGPVTDSDGRLTAVIIGSNIIGVDGDPTRASALVRPLADTGLCRR